MHPAKVLVIFLKGLIVDIVKNCRRPVEAGTLLFY